VKYGKIGVHKKEEAEEEVFAANNPVIE